MTCVAINVEVDGTTMAKVKTAMKKNVCPERLQPFIDAAHNLKAVDLVALDLRALTSFTDFFLVCSGTSDRHAQSIADDIYRQRKALGELPVSYEGHDTGQWILLDYGDVVAHIFQADAREFYQIEQLWADAPHIPCE